MTYLVNFKGGQHKYVNAPDVAYAEHLARQALIRDGVKPTPIASVERETSR